MKFIIAAIIVFIIFIIIKACSRPQPKKSSPRNYYHEVKKNLSIQEKDLFDRQVRHIENINKLIERQANELKSISIETEREIKNQIINAENQIEKYWRSKNTGFYYFIALHYQSFLLADTIKKDSLYLQNVNKNINAQIANLNNRINPIQNKIDNKQATNEDYTLIKKLHIVRKDLFGKRDVIKALISEKEHLVTEQNKRTARRRDYIKNNFGSKGRDWERRMRLRHS